MKNSLPDFINKIRISHVLIIWLLVNITSAIFTELYSDEAYYTLFAKNLAFGYFDHPPMIALFIRTGLLIFNTEIGVRLLSVIAVTIALYYIYKLAEVHKPFLFLVAVFSIFGLNVLGFLALPDGPLLLFSVLFFVQYKKFLSKEGYLNSILLGIIVAAMLYSKYHGLLIIIFTVISNLSLLRSRKFYVSAGTALLIFSPHIIWQINNNFVTIYYHLFERSASAYKVAFTLEYLSGQLLYYGPVSAGFMFFSAIKFRKSDLFEKALKWNLAGFLGFFLISTLKGRVEVNWTLPVIIPLLIFFLKTSYSKPGFERWFCILAVPVIIIIIFLRLNIITPISKLRLSSRFEEFRANRELGMEVADKCQGLPIVTNNYQRAGIVSFYAKTFASSINVNGRRNQFNLWHADDFLRYRKVAYLNNYMDDGVEIQNHVYKDYKITIIDSLPVMNDILISTSFKNIEADPGEKVEFKIQLFSKKSPDNYRDAGSYSTRLHATLYKDDILMNDEVCTLPIDLLLKNNNGEYNFQFKTPGQKGRFKILISLNTIKIGLWSTKKTINLTVR